MNQAIDWQESMRLAESFFSNGYSCSQCVIAACCEDLNLDQQDAYRIASGFGGGCGFGEVCGAVAGAVMVIGLLNASVAGDAADKQAAGRTYKQVRRFMFEFRSRFGSVRCRDLIGYDISELDEYQDIQDLDRNLFARCPSYVQTALELLKETSC